MKTQHTLTAAVAAILGLSMAAAYAAPDYTPDANSPINTTTFTSASSNLNNFDDFIGVIDSYLSGTKSLVVPTPGGSTFPLFADYNAAVTAAVLANPSDAQKIVNAAVQYTAANYGNKVKDIVKGVATANPLLAEDAVIGAIAGNPSKAADAASGAILGLIAATTETAADFDAAAAEVVDPLTHAQIEKVAKAAVASTKTAGAALPVTAITVAQSIVDEIIADGVTLYIDDVARGISGGAKGIPGTTQPAVAAAALSRFNGTAYESTKFVAEFAAGAMKPILLGGDLTAMQTALGAEPLVGAGFTDAIAAVAQAHTLLRTPPSGTEVAAFTTGLNVHFAQAEAFMIGAVQNKSGKAADFVTATFTNVNFIGTTPSVATKQAVVGAAVRGKFTGAAKVTTAAITAAGGLTRTQAVQAAIPSATWDIAGAIAGAAVKTVTGVSNVATTGDNEADDVASAALSTAVGAGYAGAINDIALAAAKAKKAEAPAIVQTLVANPDSAGWREAIVAQAVINDKANVALIKMGALAGATTAGSTDFEKASLVYSGTIAALAKTTPKSAYDDAINDFFAAPVPVGSGSQPSSDFAKAIFFGRGGVNIKNAGPLLAIALKFSTGAESDTQLLGIAKALYKKNSAVLDLQYNVIQDALANPDEVFDLVDHSVFTAGTKFAPDIAAAAAAARPEYAHYIARAASFRAPASAGKIGAAAITFAHMKSNRDTSGAAILDPNDPAAVAAISAATVLGIKDAKLATAPTNKELAAIKSAVGGLVKAAALLEDDDTGFRQSDGTSGGIAPNAKARGAAGAVTGIIAQLQGPADALDTLSATAITAAIKAAKTDTLAIAQAAAQAAQFVYQLNLGNNLTEISFAAAIVSAVTAGNPTAVLSQVQNAVQFGIDEAQANNYGAGAAGILNYAHRSGILPPVTSLENF